MINKDKRVKILRIAVVGILLVTMVFFFYSIRQGGIIGFAVLTPELVGKDPSLVLNLTFNNLSDPWKDYSVYGHVFSAMNTVSYADKTKCKWYGCADFTPNTRAMGNSIDYLNSTAQWTASDGISIMFWLYHTVGSKIDGGKSQGYFMMSDNPDQSWKDIHVQKLTSSGFGMGSTFEARDGIVSNSEGSVNYFHDNQWYHFFISYNPKQGRLYIWRNGILMVNSSEPYGPLNYSKGDKIWIGRLDGIDMQGYIDEFVVWNRSDFTEDDVLFFFNSQKAGTPPDKDIYVKDIKYTLPIDWNAPNNPLIPGTMKINFTLANAGIQTTGSFNYQFELDGNIVCSGRVSLSPLTQNIVTCDWVTSYGFHKGQITVDTSGEIGEDVETNNAQKVYIPFLDRPWFHFNLNEWKDTIEPFDKNPANSVAYDAYDWAKSFGCSGFSDSYTGNNVDPYGKKARECALGCLVNNYQQPQYPSKQQCDSALKHLLGWASRSVTSYSNVQAMHELAHVGMTYDIMFPYLTEEQNSLVTQQLHDICQHVTNFPNARPDLDDDTAIVGDNGKGFGAGVGGFCYALLGAYSENPTLIQKNEQMYSGKNIADEWMDREISYLRSFKDDAWAKYQERWAYKFYSQFHLVENWLFEKKYGLANIDEYQNALCSMAREMITDTLDFTYNGDIIRNDQTRYFRGVQAGDSRSYDDPSSGKLQSYAQFTYYGLLCDDLNTKKALRWLRDYAHTSDTTSQNKYLDAYLYSLLVDSMSGAAAVSPSTTFPHFIFDNANDIITLRSDYSYSNDDVIQIDGGEEKGAGHSQAQGYYLYALGEPFLDYEQVPYYDDVRPEMWKNGISLQNSAQTVEGTQGAWSYQCGNAPYNQYYGMSTCPSPVYPDDYPNYRQFPLEYGGDVENYVGTSDGEFAGAYVWRPYKNANPVEEYFVKYGDLLAKRTIVSGNKQGQGVYHNFINIGEEFTEIRNGADLTFTRNGKNMDINLVFANQSMALGGGITGLAYCFSKTSCSGSYRGLGHYRRTYLYTPANDVDFIIAHNWYYTGGKQAVTALTSGPDKGLQQASNVIIYDTNEDGTASYNGKQATGWAMVYNDNAKEIGAFNTNSITAGGIQLFTSNSPIAVFIARSSDKIILTVNTMKRNGYIDYPTTVRVTIDGQELALNSDFTITKNSQAVVNKVSESGTKVTFDVTSGQNSDYYTILGGGVYEEIPEGDPLVDNPPSATANQPSFFFSSTSSSSISFDCSASDDYLLSSVSLYTNQSGKLAPVYTATPNAKTYTLLTSRTFSDGYYSWLCSAIDNASQWKNTSLRTIYIGNHSPAVTLIRPADNYNSAIATVDFSCTATDADADLAGMKLWTNLTGAWLASYSEAASGSSHSLAKSLAFSPGFYAWTCSASDSMAGQAFAATHYLNVSEDLTPPTYTKFDGRTTDFSSLESYSNLEDVTIEDTATGMIVFTGTITSAAGIDFDSAITIGTASITVDDGTYSQLNVSANLTLYNINMANPRILQDGTACTSCENRAYSGTTYSFTVPHFTTFTIEETPSNESNDTTTGTTEGSSSSSSSSSGGGGGGGGGASLDGPGKGNTKDQTEKPAPPGKDNTGKGSGSEKKTTQNLLQRILSPDVASPNDESAANLPEGQIFTQPNFRTSISYLLIFAGTAIFGMLLFQETSRIKRLRHSLGLNAQHHAVKYIKHHLKYGYSFESLRKSLLKKGYPKSVVDGAISYMRSQGHEPLKTHPDEASEPMDETTLQYTANLLVDYIEKQMNEGFDSDDISVALQSYGHSKKAIERAIHQVMSAHTQIAEAAKQIKRRQ